MVDASDLSRLLQGFNGQGSGWNFGDTNYDGQINFTDLGRLQTALRGQAAPLSTITPGGPGAPIPKSSSPILLSPLALLTAPPKPLREAAAANPANAKAHSAARCDNLPAHFCAQLTKPFRPSQ